MRVPSSRIFAILSLAFLGFTPAAAHADPILVTGGSIGLLGPGPDPAGASLFGDGLRLGGDGHGGATGPIGSQPGDVGQVSGSFNFSAPHPFNVTVNGTNYNAFLVGGLNFTSSPFTLPEPTPVSGGGFSFQYQVPFTMTGRVQGFTQSFPGNEPPLFDVDLAGSGTLTAFQPFAPGFGSTPSFGGRFSFEAAASPTPEPASMLLLGTGAAGLFIRRRKQR